MNVHVRFFAVAAFAALTWVSAPLAAQSAVNLDSLTAVAGMAATDTSTTSMAAGAAVRGPSAASARVAVHAISSTRRAAPPVIQKKSSSRNSVALMIVGGAALVIGAVIGNDAGTLVMLGGAGIGLYGLYLFLT